MRCAMDPISVTTTVITLATFVKDLLSLGQSIRRSFEKVKTNRKLVLALTEDIICTLGRLHELTAGNESDFLAPHLVRALEDLKADILHARFLTDRLAAAGRKQGLRGFGVRFRTWLKRHDIESAIKSVKEHVDKCFLQFTAFSVSRTECTAFRIEHAITVQKVENSMDLRRIESMMTKLVHETQFGNEIMQQAASTISSLATNKSFFLSSLCETLVQISTYLGNRGYATVTTVTTSSELNGTCGQILALGEKLKNMEFLTTSIQTTLLIFWWMVVGIFSPFRRKVGEVS
ncbi:Tetratricopeptide repeat family [Mycena sanguinolenta]|uniref:Tetratricopeptide repeat family n=1 Tax=Mycena sanguinolenta TaxID=230812 RepID=A0A8H6YYC3_9AGAR|nr:Tetratricopeptide repeat family [Mycena sanguinolenta]